MLKDKSALVTGSTSGIGRAIAVRLAEAGCKVTLNGFGDAAEIETQRAELARRCGVEVRYSGADMGEPAQIDAMMADAVDAFGGVDILVNNAGIQHVAPIDEFPAERWQQIIAINLTAAFYTVRGALPAMKRAGWGRIINIASAHGLVASPYKSAYVSAKHGMMGLTKTVALEVAENGITCNAVCPGYVKTPLVEGQIADTAAARGISEETVARDVILHAQPTKQFVRAEQIGELVAFLCSDAAASMTGAALPIDGGWTAK